MLFFNCFIWLLTSFLHPFHVSVSSIRYASEENALQITMKIFADDLEEALNKPPYRNAREPYVDVLNPENINALSQKVEQYIRENFELSLNGELAKPVFLGFEIEDMAMWCYMEVRDVEKVENIKVRNSVLVNTYDDQVNIVHVDYHDHVKSMKLTKNKLIGEVGFE